MISLILSLIIFVLLISFIRSKVRLVKLASKIPGHNGIPFIGVITEFFGVDNEKIFETMQKYTKWPDSIAKIWLGPELIIVVNSPECIQTIFNSVDCLERPNFYDFIDLKKGLLFGRVDVWKSHRKILNRAFTVQKLKSFVPDFNKKLNIFVRNLESCTGVDIDIFSLVSSCFLETFLKTTMEYDSDIQGNCMNIELLDVHDRTIETITNRMSKVWLHSDIVNSILKVFQRKRKIYVNELLKYVDNIRKNIKVCCFNININDIMENKSEYLFDDDDDDVKERKSVESLIKILENPQYGFSDNEIEDELITVLLAAQDTTSLILSTSMLMLAMHKSVQQKAFDEVREHSQFNDFSYDTISRFQYIEMIIKETLRLFPVDHMTLRTASADIVLNDILIPRDSKLVIPVFNVHRNENIWGNDAASFKPERFEYDEFKNIHPYAFIPFTGGSRICLGRKYAMLFMKTCLAKLLLNYELDTKLNFNDIKLKFSITLKLAEDYVITLKKRQV
jgi:cytochrome P450